VAKDYLLTFLSTGVGGVEYANTICVHDDELGGPRDVGDVVDLVDTWLRTPYKNLLVSSTTVDVLRCFRIPDVFGTDSNVTSKLIGQPGTLTGPDGKLPREMTLTLSLRSNHTSRRSQGRLSIPSPLNSAYVDSSGNWSTGSAFWSAVGTFGDALLAGHDVGVLGVDGHLSTRVYSRQTHKEASGDKTHDVDTYIRRARPRWLRRRVSIP
jgi:hypothetical protein